MIDHAGLSSRAADQLGHANTSMTTDVYFGRAEVKVATTGAARKVATTGAAAVLEALAP